MLQNYLWCTTGLHSWTQLFLIYINDLFRSSTKLTPIMFAADTKLFISDSNIENLFEKMNEVLRKVANWFKSNKLSLNISKTKYSLFHSTRKRKDIPNILPQFHIDNVPVKREFVTKFLSVYLMKTFPGSIILIL